MHTGLDIGYKDSYGHMVSYNFQSMIFEVYKEKASDTKNPGLSG